MVAIPQTVDLTLEKADAALVAAQPPRFRAYLGMSEIGKDCSRALWYSFRWVAKPSFDALTLKRFEDGHRSESLVISRLKAVPGLEIHELDESEKQFGFTDFGGHFRGHMDFVALGIVQAPATWHVGEVKASDKWDALDKSKAKVGEKNALLDWNPVYYGQAICYMDYAGLDRHWLISASPGARRWTSVRTNADPAHALVLKNKAERIIFADAAPDRIGGPDSFACRWCDFQTICHGGQPALRNCRTCVHATPMRAGGWFCSEPVHGNYPLSLSDQEAGCPSQRMLPSLVNGEQVDVRDAAIIYRLPDGREWADNGPDGGVL